MSKDETLRRGWTTGACATAAAKAAYTACLTGGFPDPVTIALPRGGFATFALAERERRDAAALAGVVKDAGDDPDVTHGALVRATVRPLSPGAGVVFRAGEGVGTVTRPGLPLPVGEPAINPAPRAMIAAALAEVAGSPADAEVTIAIPGGEALAARTLNGRLGIVGGLSVLGTSGVVVPFSCAAWVASIHRGIDVARAAGVAHVVSATGSTSERAAQALYGLPDLALIEMGDFVGGTLKYLRRHPVPRVTLAGGFGKLSKLAAGHLDLHSKRSTVDVGALADWLVEAGGDGRLADEARGANSAGEVLVLADAAGLSLANRVAQRARAVATDLVAGAFALDVAVFDRKGALIGRAD